MTGPAAKSDTSSVVLVRIRKPLIALFSASVFLYWVSLYLYAPTLPVYAYGKTNSLAIVGLILSMYGLWQAIIRLPLGIASDWFGWRKPFIVLGLALTGLGAWLMGVAVDANMLILGRAVTGLAAGTWVPLVVVFSGFFPPDEAVRASALLTLVSSIARMFATSVTGWLNDLGGYSLAFFLAAGAAVLAILAMLPVPEKRRPHRQSSSVSIRALITRRDVLFPSLLNAVSQYGIWTSTFGFLPIVAKQLGATDVMLSALVASSIGAVSLGNIMATAIVRKIGARSLVCLSFILIFVGIGGAALAQSLLVVLFGQLCIGLSQGIGYPVLMGMSMESVDYDERATAMGLHQAVYAIGMFAGPWLSGILADTIGIPPMLIATAVACLALGLLGTRRLSQINQ